MTSPGVDRRVTSEDCIEASIALIRNHQSKNIIPAISNTGHIVAAQASSKQVPVDDPSPPKKQKRSHANGESLARSLKQVYKHILATVTLHLGLLERIDALVQSVPLDDRPVLTLATTALSVFAVEIASASHTTEAAFCNLLHVESIALITSIFQKYPRHRTIIMEDLFPLMLNLPASKKSLRTFSVQTETDVSGLCVKRALFPSSAVPGQEQQCIQAMTALVLSLIQSCVADASFPDGGRDWRRKTIPNAQIRTRAMSISVQLLRISPPTALF